MFSGPEDTEGRTAWRYISGVAGREREMWYDKVGGTRGIAQYSTSACSAANGKHVCSSMRLGEFINSLQWYSGNTLSTVA